MVSSAKFRGIIIDELGWGEHINRITKNIASGSYAIYSVKKVSFHEQHETRLPQPYSLTPQLRHYVVKFSISVLIPQA